MDNINHLVEQIRGLSDEEFMQLGVMTFNQRSPTTQKTFLRRVNFQGKKNKKHLGDGWKGMSAEGNQAEYPSQPEPEHEEEPKPCSSKEPSRSAFQVPFIHRGDLVPDDGVVFLDVEKLSMKKYSIKEKHQQVASEIAVVNENRDLILWSFIQPLDPGKICQTFPQITRITKEKLEIGQPLTKVQEHFKMVLNGNKLVGWNVGNDLLSLGITATNVLDLAKDYFKDENDQEYSLKDTYEHFFGKKIQCEAHCAIIDARATRDVYFKYLELVKMYPNWIDYPKPIKRSPKDEWVNDPNDLCSCPKKKKTKKVKKNAKGKQFFVPA